MLTAAKKTSNAAKLLSANASRTVAIVTGPVALRPSSTKIRDNGRGGGISVPDRDPAVSNSLISTAIVSLSGADQRLHHTYCTEYYVLNLT